MSIAYRICAYRIGEPFTRAVYLLLDTLYWFKNSLIIAPARYDFEQTIENLW